MRGIVIFSCVGEAMVGDFVVGKRMYCLRKFAKGWWVLGIEWLCCYELCESFCLMLINCNYGRRLFGI